MESEDSAEGSAARFAAYGRDLIKQGWQLLAACVPLQSAAFGADAHEVDEALEQVRTQLDELLVDNWTQRSPLAGVLEWLIGITGQASAMASALSAAPPARMGLDALNLIKDLPKLGPLQQRQERLEAAVQSLDEHWQAQHEFAAIMRVLNDKTMAKLKERLRAPLELSDSQALYHEWLSASEQAYEEVLHSEAYAQALGRLSNATIGLIRHIQEGLEDLLSVLNLPTRADMISTQRRLHDLRRRHHALAEGVDPSDFRALQEEVAELRRELTALKKNCGRSGTNA